MNTPQLCVLHGENRMGFLPLLPILAAAVPAISSIATGASKYFSSKEDAKSAAAYEKAQAQIAANSAAERQKMMIIVGIAGVSLVGIIALTRRGRK